MLTSFFNPRSIAIIGASRNEQKIGHTILKNIIESGYGGKIYPVNPETDKILEKKCYSAIEKLPRNINLAIIAIPAQFVLEAIRECGEKGIKNIILISAGFRENGSNGLKLEKEMIEIAKTYDLKILGPNCLGILDSHTNLNVSFANGMIEKGNISFISQSGAICSAMLDWAKNEHIGFSKFVSLGNMMNLNELDFLEYLSKDAETTAVVAYLENFSAGKKFIEAAKKLSAQKPLIIIKSGNTEKGKSLSMSHTGSMAEDKSITSAVLKQVNAIHCKTVEEMFNLIKLFNAIQIPQNENIAIIGNAGGVNVITADALSEKYITAKNFEPSVAKNLQNILPSMAQINNPLDIIGDANAERYKEALSAVIKDRSISTILITLTPQTVTEPLETAKIIYEISKKAKKNKKNIIANFIGGESVKKAIEYLSENNTANFPYPEIAINAINSLNVWKRNNEENKEEKKIAFAITDGQKEEINKILKNKAGLLDYQDGKNIMDILEMPVLKGIISSDLKELNEFAQKNNYPVVMKALADNIIHKTKKNAVRLDIKTPQEMAKNYEQLIKLGGKYKTKILTQPMITNAIEIIIGAKRDNKFGPVILFGLGGIYTEIFKDISLRIAPITSDDAKKMISEIRAAKIFENARNQNVKKEELIDILLKISFLMENFPTIKEIDLNPVMIKAGKIHLADIRVILE
ncbi:MAG: acetate--CoA ligase family protein [bacterium]